MPNNIRYASVKVMGINQTIGAEVVVQLPVDPSFTHLTVHAAEGAAYSYRLVFHDRRNTPQAVPTTADERAYLQRLGQALRFARQLRGLTQEQLADKTSMSKHVISRIECGREQPTILRIREIGSALQMPPAAIIQAADPHHEFQLEPSNTYTPGWTS